MPLFRIKSRKIVSLLSQKLPQKIVWTKLNGKINGTINGTIKLSETATIFAAMFSDEIFVQEMLAQITTENLRRI